MVPRRDGKRLERREETTGAGAGAAQMAAAAHRGGDGSPPGDGERLPQGGRDRRAAAGVVGAASAKSGQRDVHRPGSKTGQRGVHRLARAGSVATAPRAGAGGKRVRAVPRDHRAGPRPWSQREGDLAGPSRRPSLRRRLCEREALHPQAARRPIAGGAPHHRRLRRGPDGARPLERKVPPHAALRADARPQPQVGPAADLPIQLADLGGAARDGFPPPGRRAARDGARQPARGRAPRRHLRSRAQPALPRCARPLRRDGAPVPRARP